MPHIAAQLLSRTGRVVEKEAEWYTQSGGGRGRVVEAEWLEQSSRGSVGGAETQKGRDRVPDMCVQFG